MFAYFRKRKAREEEHRQTEIAAQREHVELLKHLIYESKKAMLESPCAINNMDTCKKECVHFENGSVYRLPDFYSGSMKNMAKYPKCKLWA